MLPSELKLTSLGHCYVHLPETFVSRDPAVKGGAIVSVKSIQSDIELFVIWNGQLTSGEYVELDLVFGQSNDLKDELVILTSIDNLELPECSSCRVELLESSDYSILSQHSEANLLDTCRLVFLGLVVPIFISQHVKVLVKVISFEPSDKPQVLLTKWTELSFMHKLTELPDNGEASNQPLNSNIDQRYSPPLISSALQSGNCEQLFNFVSLLICGIRGSGKTYFMKKVLHNYKSCHSEYLNCKNLRGKRPETVKKTLSELVSRAQENSSASIIALDDIDSILDFDPKHAEEQGQEILYKKRLIALFCSFLKQFERPNPNEAFNKKNLIVIASCRSFESLDRRISEAVGRYYFDEILNIGMPDLNTRVWILKNLIAEHQQITCNICDSDLEEVAQKCGSFMPYDLRRIFERALINACSRSSLEFSSEKVNIDLADLSNALQDYLPINLRNVSLQPKNNLRAFDQIGGMKSVKDILMKTVLLPLSYPILFKKCPIKSQSSILLYGPPGCGKTMIAEALCNQSGLNSICVRGPELLSKYIGASEASVRSLFKRAQLARPCVIFFDEFDSLVAKRGSDSTGVTDRVVNQFLTILDGVESLMHDVFIIAATSRPDMIDPAMLRPGRLDKHIYCALPDEQDRLEILKILTRSVNLKDNIDLVEWASRTDKFTGADVQSLLCSAQFNALNELIETKKSGPNDNIMATKQTTIANDELEIIVSQIHIEKAFDEMKRDIEINHVRLLSYYPQNFNRLNRQQVAARTTLA